MDAHYISVKPDSLNASNVKFKHAPLKQPVFLNSLPKCGTHLIKNIFRMFVPIPQQYNNDFIQYPSLESQHGVFKANPPLLSWGHLLFADTSAMVLKDVPHILLVRDPYDWVLARARFFLSDNFKGNLEHLKDGRSNIDDYLNMMIVGVMNRVPTLQETFLHNAIAWLGTSAKLVHYEDLVKHVNAIDTPDAKAYFETLLGYGNIELPADWKERVMIGSDRKQSGTARENLELNKQAVPDTLPDMQKKLVDVLAPGYREILGYT